MTTAAATTLPAPMSTGTASAGTACAGTAPPDLAPPDATGTSSTGPAGFLPAVPGAAGPGATTPRLRLLRHEPEPDHVDGPADDDGVARRAPVRGLPPPAPDDLRPTVALRRRAHHVLWLVLEVVDGRRPLTHLAPHLEPSALRYVRAARGPGTARQASRMTSLHVHRPCAGAVEVAAVRRAGRRARAVAARFEGRPDEPDRWRCVTLRLM